MSVSAPIPAGVVSKIEGSVRVIRAGGKTAGALKVGDALQEGDAVIATAGASLQLMADGGQAWETPAEGLPAGEALRVGEFDGLTIARETLLAQGQANLDDAVARLNEASEEDAPAAGLAGGATGALSEGLRVDRVQESVGSQEFEYGTTLVDPGTEPFLSGTINGEEAGNAAPVIDPASPRFDPVAGNYSVTTSEDSPVSGKVIASDADGDTLTYATGTPPANGSVTVGTDGAWTYTPKPDYNGSDSFTVTVSDGKGGTTTATVNVGVTPVNDAPLAVADAFSTAEDTAITFQAAQLLANDTDVDSSNLSIASVTSGKGGTAVLNADGTVTFTPNANFNGTADFSYTVTDGALTSAPATVTVTVTPVNDLPVIDPTSPNYDPATGNYSVTTDEDTPVSGQVVASDADGNPLTYAVGNAPAHGAVTVNPDGTWSYTPGANYNGSDSFTVTVSDGQGGTTTATVNVGVTPVNDAPLATADTATVAEGASVLINVAANDSDVDSVLDLSSIVISSAPANGTVTVNADGTVNYQHNGSEATADTFSYTIKDAQGLTSEPVSVSIAVTPVNDLPVIDPNSPNYDPAAGNYSVTTDEDTPVSGKVVASDADGDALTYALGTAPANGTVAVNAKGSWTYAPAPNFNGADSFTVTVSDGKGGSTTAIVNVGVTPVNDAPVAMADNATVTEGGNVLVNLAGNDSDLDSALDLSSIVITSAPAYGTITVNANGTVSYQHDGSETTADSFSYTIRDAQGLISSPVSVTIAVTGDNDAPVIDPSSHGFDPVTGNYSVTTDEDTPVSGKVVASDADGDALTYAPGTPPANGSVTVATDGTWTYTPKPDYSGSDSFTVTVSDGKGGTTTATVNVGITPVDDATVVANDSTSVDEDSSVVIDVLANDTDIDSAKSPVANVTQGSNGAVSINADGTLTYTPKANFSGADSFTYTNAEGNTATVNVTVTPVNDKPVVDRSSPNYNPNTGNYSVTTEEDTPVSGKVVASDVDGDTLTYALGTGPSNGAVTVNVNGTWSYTPAANFNGSDSFTVTVSDENGGVATATVNVGVTPANDAPVIDPSSPGFDPVAGNYSVTTDEDTPVSGQVVASDADGDTLAYAVGTSPVSGTVTVNPNGTWTYTPSANFNGSDSFTVTVSDGNGGVATATVNVGVTPANDVPVIDPSSQGFNPVAGNYSVTTDEDTPVSGKVVASDVDGDTLTYAPGTPPANGSVTVGTDGAWTYTPKPDYNGSDSFTVTVSDGKGGTTTATINVGITPVDDATVVANDTASVDEDSSVVIDVLANDTDIDSAKSPVISATQGSNGAVAINADGTLTYTPKANSSGADSFTYTNAEGNTATVNVTVNPVNDKPVVDPTSPNYNPNTGNYNVTTEEDTPVSGKVVASDADGDALTYALGTGPSNGAVTVNANGTWSYTPAANFNGSDSFTVTVSDENGGVATATVNVGVTPVNDAPVATADSATVAEGGNVHINLAGNDGDVDSALDLASIVITSAPAYGTVTVNSDGTVSYQHDGSETTADSFSYTIKDAQGLSSPPVSVTITVTGDNDAPVIDPISPGFDPVTGNYSVTTAEDTPVSGQVVGTDADGNTLAYALGTSPVSGTVTVNPNGTWTYTPSANFNGSDSFTVTVSDGNGGMATATVNVGVTPANDAPVIDPSSPGFDPVAGSYSVTTDEDTPVSGKVVASDVDGDTLTYAPGTPPANGSVTVGTDGAWTYTPKPDYNGSDSFTVTVSDGKGGTTTATINVGITPVDDATVVANDTASVDEDSSVVIDVLANDTDIDSAKSPVISATQGSNGTVAINADGTLTYTPKANFSGADSFTYTNAEGNTATVNVTVTPLNDKPVVAPTSPNYNPNTGNYSVTTAEDTPVSGQVVASDADGDTLAYAVGTSPVSGTVTVNPNGTWTYTPSANFNGADSFTVIVSDGNGGVATATVNVGVTPANDAPVVDPSSPGFDPVAGNYSVTTDEDTPVSGQVVSTDADRDTLTYALGASPANGNVSVNANGSWTYTPAANFNGSDSFTVTVSDGNGGVATATVNVGVTPANDVPVIDPSSQGFNPVAGNYSVTTDEDTPVSGKVVASDVDGDALTYAPGTPPANGSVTVATDGAWTYTPKPDYNGSDSFTVTVSDGKGGTTTATINVDITPVDDATVVRSDTASVDEDSSVVTDVLANDTDIDSAKSPVTSVTQGRNGAVAINADGTLTYTPKANFSGADSFTYTNAEGNTATVNVTVNPLNDAPVTSNQAKTTAEDTPVTGKVVASDVDGDTLSYSIQSAAAHGTLVLNTTTGDYTYTPTANYNGADNFTVRVSDGKGGFVDSVVNVTVTPVNDAPVTANQAKTTAEETPVTGKVVASDVDGDTLSYSIQSAAAHGTLVLNTTTGDYTYTPTANYNGADNFTVRVSDGKGGFVDSVVNITVTPVNDAPIVGTTSATLLESNLSGSKTTQSGVISVSDVDSNALTVRLTQPTAKLTSGGNAVVWTLSQDGKTLVGSAGSAEIIRASIDDQGNYSVTLSKPIDHATVQGQNTASFNIGVTASDGTLNTLSALSVNIIDDTPQTNAITDNLRVRTDNITVSNLDAGFTGDTYLNGTSQVTRTDVDSHDTYVDRLRWGNAATSAGQSGYDLVDNTTLTSSTGTSITEGTPFKLGDFTHTNYGIYSGSSTLGYTDVTIRLDVVINGVPTPVTFTVRLSHTETTNSNDLIASRDIITLPTQTVSIQIAGQSYTVSLLGFKDKAGNIVNTIYTDENTNNNTFGIYAQISSTQPPVQSSGELLSHAGADGAYLSEVVIDGTRYAYTPTNGGSLSVVSGTNRGTFNAGEQTLTVKTLLGGTFVVDLDGGQYTYTAPTTVTANFSDRFEFTVRDTDGDTASSSVVVNVAPPATVELSNNGIPYQAGSDPENINGSVGNDTIYGGNGADHINGGAGNDVLIGNAGNDLLFGGAGSDRIEGGLGVDRIQGGAGNDTLTGDVAGSPFADVFAWSLSDRGTGGNGRAVDTITDFSTAARAAGGDVLDLRDLLQGENTSGGVGNLTRYLDIDTSGADTVIRVSSTGSFSNGNYASGSEDQRIVLTGVNLRTDMGLSTTAGDQQVIQELLNRGKLLVDNS